MPSGFQLAQRQAQAYESFTRTFMEGSAQLLAEGTSIAAGDVVLDLACGTGLVARHVVPLVVPGGRVVGADVNGAMLEIARNAVAGEVEWVEAPCDALPFEDETFTHAICQQGFQFFPDPIAAMSEAKRVLCCGGVLVATVWATPGHNPYIENQLQLLAAVDPSLSDSVARSTPPNADEFLLSAARSAGFSDVAVSLLEHTVEIADFNPWFLAQTGGTPWGPTLATLTDDGRRELADKMAARISEYSTPGVGHRIPFRSYRLEARRPD